MDVSEKGGIPKSSILIGFSIIFTIHFGGFPPIFASTPIFFKISWFNPPTSYILKEPQSFLAVFVMQRDGQARLDFIQNVERIWGKSPEGKGDGFS